MDSIQTQTQEYIKKILTDDKRLYLEKMDSVRNKVLKRIEDGTLRHIIAPYPREEDDGETYDIYEFEINKKRIEFQYRHQGDLENGQTRFSIATEPGKSNKLTIDDLNCLQQALDANRSHISCDLLP